MSFFNSSSSPFSFDPFGGNGEKPRKYWQDLLLVAAPALIMGVLPPVINRLLNGNQSRQENNQQENRPSADNESATSPKK